MSLYHLVLLLALLVPLGVDMFLLSAALGLTGLPKEQQVRTSLMFVAFEAGMPVVGVLLGRSVGGFLGSLAGYTAAAVIGLAGVLLLRPGQDSKKEQDRLRLLARARGLAVLDLGISISVDELALGVSLGLLQVPLLAAVIFVGVQSFAAAQLGFWFGGHLSTQLREGAERLVGAALVAIAIALIPADVASQGYAFGMVSNVSTMSQASDQALDLCRTAKGASGTARGVCKVVQTLHQQCAAVAMDPAKGTPGAGWAVAYDKKAAESQALRQCYDTAGADVSRTASCRLRCAILECTGKSATRRAGPATFRAVDYWGK